MAELTEQELYAVQVIEERGDVMRVYDIEAMHLGDDDDPLTTIQLTGKYQDVPL